MEYIDTFENVDIFSVVHNSNAHSNHARTPVKPKSIRFGFVATYDGVYGELLASHIEKDSVWTGTRREEIRYYTFVHVLLHRRINIIYTHLLRVVFTNTRFIFNSAEVSRLHYAIHFISPFTFNRMKWIPCIFLVSPFCSVPSDPLINTKRRKSKGPRWRLCFYSRCV